MRRSLTLLLPVLGAAGFIVFSELSLKREGEFFLWSLATGGWILAVFAVLAVGRIRGRLLWVSIPAVLMIVLSVVTSLLFLDLVSPRRGFVIFFALVLYLFFEHVRHEIANSSQDERITIAEFARMVNIGSLFLLVSAGLGMTIFLPIPFWWTLIVLVPVAVLWSWHLYAACYGAERPVWQVAVSSILTIETYLVALRLPTSMFVGGALAAVVYYSASNVLRAGAEPLPPKLARKYLIMAAVMVAAILLTARWVE
jgi:hypothetical protein